MAIYTVMESEDWGDQQIERAVFVRDGFSWRAFLFGPVWLLLNGMVLLAIAYVVVVGAVSSAAAFYLPEPAAFLVVLLLQLWFAFEAPALRRFALAGRGYILHGVVEARRPVDAERRYFRDRLYGDAALSFASTPSSAATGFARPGRPAVLGLFPEGPR